MTDRTMLWEQMQGAIGAIASNLSPAVRAKLEEASFEIQNLFGLGVAYYVHPQPIVLTHLRQRNPYSHESTLHDTIQRLRDAGLVDDDDVITDSAYAEYQSLIDTQDQVASELDQMDHETLITVVNYLKRAHNNALKLNAPSFKLVTSRPLPENAPHTIYYLIYRFMALRDDAHIQAWKPLGIDGLTHEAASLIWDSTAKNASELSENRAYRGYGETDWQNTLDKLVDKGWLVQDGDDYQVTDDYKNMRDDIETKTDDFFYQIFDGFSDDEIAELSRLLVAIQEKFTPEPQTS